MGNRPYGFEIYSVNVKTIRTIAQILVAFSGKLNFNTLSLNTQLCFVRIFMKQTLELKKISVLFLIDIFFQISAGILMGHLQNQNQKRILGPNVTSAICQAQITILYVVTNVKDVIILAVLFLP